MADNTGSGKQLWNPWRDNPVEKNGSSRAKGGDLALGNDEIEIDKNLLIDRKYLVTGSIISEGPCSMVYEGWYKNLPVAVKVMQPDQTSGMNSGRIDRFLREVSMLSRLNHDNLVKFIGASTKPNMIITELMKGGSLKKYLWDKRPGCLDLQTSVRFALDVARVMEYLHANGIIHRDLKPGNLLLTEDQKQLKLTDFGLAREETIEEMMSSEVGTYRWMAPELYSTVPLRHGEKRYYDHKVDIYSFAIVLWELLTNSTPFKGMSGMQTAYAVAKKQRPSVETIQKDFVPILKCCWAENPADRPEFTEIIATLSANLDSMQPDEQQATPPPLMNAIDQQDCTLAIDSPGTRHLIDKSGEIVQGKSKSSSPKFLKCFDKCFAM